MKIVTQATKVALTAACAGLLLAGCAASTANFAHERPIPQGPAPKVMYASTEEPLACVVSQMTPQQRKHSFGVIGFPDSSGSENRVGNDSFGTFNTQGAGDILYSAVKQTGVRTIELRPHWRVLMDWLADKTQIGARNLVRKTLQTSVEEGTGRKTTTSVSIPASNVQMPEFGLMGSIPTTDFMPGEGGSFGVLGATVSTEANWAITTMDMQIIQMPYRGKSGGEHLFTSTVKKQMAQDSFRLGLTRLVGDKPTYLHFELGAGRREPMKYSARAMVQTLLAHLFAQMYNIGGCFPEPEYEPAPSVVAQK